MPYGEKHDLPPIGPFPQTLRRLLGEVPLHGEVHSSEVLLKRAMRKRVDLRLCLEEKAGAKLDRRYAELRPIKATRRGIQLAQLRKQSRLRNVGNPTSRFSMRRVRQ